MGSTFSPSLANLFMSWWEEQCVFSVTNPFADAIVWYGRYIDYLPLCGDAMWLSIQDFLKYLNSNDRNLKFTGQWHHIVMNFLDITLRGNPTTEKVESSLYTVGSPLPATLCCGQIVAILPTR